MKPIILGEAPGPAGKTKIDVPLGGQIGRRLAVWLQDGPDDFASWHEAYDLLTSYFDVRNLFDDLYTEPSWPYKHARLLWREFVRETPHRAVVVLLGTRLRTTVFTQRQSPVMHSFAQVDGLQVVTVPHPSGLNRIYNSQRERWRTGSTLRRAVRRASRNAEISKNDENWRV